MSRPTPYQIFAEHMEQAHPGVAYGFTSHGLMVPEKVTVDVGAGEPVIFTGLILKYKRADARITKANGSYVSDRVAVEASILDEYIKQGWIGQFARGPEEMLALVDSYLEGVV